MRCPRLLNLIDTKLEDNNWTISGYLKSAQIIWFPVDLENGPLRQEEASQNSLETLENTE